MPNVHESGEENDRQRCAVIFDEFPKITAEEITSTNDTAGIAGHKNQEGYHNGEVGGCFTGQTPLAG